MKICIIKKNSKKGYAYTALCVEKGSALIMLTFDLVTILKVTGWSVDKIDNMAIDSKIYL